MEEPPRDWQSRALDAARWLWSCRGSCCRENLELELMLSKSGLAYNTATLQRNASAASAVMSEFLAELRQQCLDEQQHYARQGAQAPLHKRNRWRLYTEKGRVQECLDNTMSFVRAHPECKTTVLPKAYLRALVLLQHGVVEDSADLCRPEEERRHCDAFEGILTARGINSQLVKDAHRSEWAIEGRAYTLQTRPEAKECLGDRKALIAAFQQELVTALEQFLVDYCKRRRLSEQGAERFMQAVSTQMSQAGLANLEHSSQASRIFVSGEGLEQRTAYNVSTMATSDKGEIVKLSIYCMKTGFKSYITPDSMLAPADDDDACGGPIHCSTESYLYQYATLGFVPQRGSGASETVECFVLDLLDEIHILPVEPL